MFSPLPKRKKKKKAGGHKKSFEGDTGDRYTYYLNSGDGMGVCICSNSSKCIHEICVYLIMNI